MKTVENIKKVGAAIYGIFVVGPVMYRCHGPNRCCYIENKVAYANSSLGLRGIL